MEERENTQRKLVNDSKGNLSCYKRKSYIITCDPLPFALVVGGTWVCYIDRQVVLSREAILLYVQRLLVPILPLQKKRERYMER